VVNEAPESRCQRSRQGCEGGTEVGGHELGETLWSRLGPDDAFVRAGTKTFGDGTFLYEIGTYSG
jgi:hypothetical protein